MKIDAAYMKYIKGRIKPVVLIKSRDLSGTLAAIYRVFHLKNNYCLYDSERILYLTNNRELLSKVGKAYNKLKGESELDSITLFSFIDDRVDFLTIDDIIEGCFNEYIINNPLLKIISEKVREELIRASLETIKKEYCSLKFFKGDYTKFFSDEIRWMKAFDYIHLEEYQNCIRAGRRYKKGEGPGSIRKNSRVREGIFKLFTLYEDKLKENNLIDLEDRERLVLEEIKNRNNYTHIIVDEARHYTKKQLEIIGRLKNNKSYGETAYIYNLNDETKAEACLTKPNKISEIYGKNKIKSFNFKKSMEMEMLSILDEEAENQTVEVVETKAEEEVISLEKFEFISLKNRSEFEFIRDITRKDSIFLLDGENQEEVGENELKEIPVFSNIAAGEPILMNPDVEETFYLPEYWVKGMDNHFILHVKGDSMINANINDGDFVVIKSTQFAQNRDIVAVNIDGSATLKRLMIKGTTAALMPENNKYRPIVITEEGAHILGVAVGLIKEKF